MCKGLYGLFSRPLVPPLRGSVTWAGSMPGEERSGRIPTAWAAIWKVRGSKLHGQLYAGGRNVTLGARSHPAIFVFPVFFPLLGTPGFPPWWRSSVPDLVFLLCSYLLTAYHTRLIIYANIKTFNSTYHTVGFQEMLLHIPIKCGYQFLKNWQLLSLCLKIIPFCPCQLFSFWDRKYISYIYIENYISQVPLPAGWQLSLAHRNLDKK